MTENTAPHGGQEIADTPDSGPSELQAQLAAFESQVAELQAQLGKRTDEAAQRRIAARNAAAEAEDQARKAGQLDEALKQQGEQLRIAQEQLEAAGPLVDLGRAYEADATRKIAKAKADLPDEVVAELEAVTTIQEKMRVLTVYQAAAARFSANIGQVPNGAPSGAPGGSPAPKPAVDLMQEMKAGRMTVAQARQYDPDQYQAISANLGRDSSRPPSPTLGLLGALRKRNAG